MAANITGPVYQPGNGVVGYIPYPVAASTTIYYGAAVGVNAAGYAVTLDDSAALKFVGICQQTVTNSGAAGSVSANVQPVGNYVYFNATSPAITWRGALVYAVYDTWVSTATGTNSNLVGRVVQIVTIGTSGVVLVNTAPAA